MTSGTLYKRAAWWTRAVRSLGTVTGLFASGLSVGIPTVAAQSGDYRSAAAAPAAWQAFAGQLLSQFEQRLGADDKQARKFQDYLAQRDAGPDAPARTVVARTWIMPEGKVERIEFDGLDDSGIAFNLRALLVPENVGAPPPDMLQPLRLRLSLRPKEQAAEGK